MNFLQVHVEQAARAHTEPHQRLGWWQQPCRQLEQDAREHAVQVSRDLTAQGYTRQEAATLLQVPPRTLRRWHSLAEADLPCWLPRGRPVLRSPREQRQEVLALLETYGPGVGLPCLKANFPEMPRAELDDLLRRYRRVWRQRHQQPLHLLRWTTPGRWRRTCWIAARRRWRTCGNTAPTRTCARTWCCRT